MLSRDIATGLTCSPASDVRWPGTHEVTTMSREETDPRMIGATIGLRLFAGPLITLFCAIALLVLASAPVNAQAHATINGTVNDSSGAVIAGAEVSIRSLQTDQVTKVTTMAEGNYSAPFLA